MEYALYAVAGFVVWAVSLAMATIAAFRPCLGAMTIKVAETGKAPRYMHLGDGGVLENSGDETLLEAVNARGPDQNARIPTALKMTPCNKERIAAAAQALVGAHFSGGHQTV